MKLLLFGILASMHAASASDFFVMPWMCLERCGDNSTAIIEQLDQYSVNRTKFTGVSYEDFNLAANATLVKNNLTQVGAPLAALGLQRWAMVSSYPYPPDFLLWMRQVFVDPAPFIDACVAAAKAENLTGFNIDWEPTDGNGAPIPTPQDAVDYAEFLDVFSKAMHSNGILTSVDVATWSPIWNYTLIGDTSIDYIMTMGTYTTTWSEWQTQFADALTLPPSKLVVGLEDDNGLTSSDLKLRFDAINGAGVRQIAIWRAGIEDIWWPFIDAFVAQNARR